MQNVVKALGDSFRALFSLKVLLFVLIPPAVAIILGVGLYFIYWQKAIFFLTESMTHTWAYDYVARFTEKDFLWLAQGIAAAILILLFIPLSYVVSLLLTSIFVMPLVQNYLGQKKFSHLEKRRGGHWVVSVINSLLATLAYLFMFVATLPLWIIPGVQILLPMVLSAWLNRRIFSYDSLQEFASKDERKKILTDNASSLFGLGFFCSVLVYVPFISFFVSVYTGMTFLFYNLKRLEENRLAYRPSQDELDPSQV